MKLLKKIFARFIAIFIGVFLAFLFGEFVIRMLYKDKMILFPRYHSCVQYGDFHTRRIKPNTSFTHTSIDGTFHFKTNNKGFRNDYDVDYDKPAGVIRVLALGDSHTQGYEVNQHETYSYICEKNLNKAGFKAQVLNTGVSGFGNSEEMIFLENEGLKYHPDAVVLGFYANDFFDNVKDGLYGLNDDSLVNQSKTFQPGTKLQDFIYRFAIVRFLSENSYLYNYVFNTVWNMSKHSLISKKRGEETTQGDDELAITGKEPTEYECKLAVKVIEHIYYLCKSNHIRFILMDIPKCAPFNSSIPDKYLGDFKHNCDTLFYTKDMREEYGKLKETHVPHGNRHISAGSHELIGNKISEYLILNFKKH